MRKIRFVLLFTCFIYTGNTQPPKQPEIHDIKNLWDGTYLTNDGQIVLEGDAKSLAAALEKALDDLPDINSEMDWHPRNWHEDDLPEWLSPDEKAMIEDGLEEHSKEVMKAHPFEFFAGDEKQNLVGLIRFCKLGSFSIW